MHGNNTPDQYVSKSLNLAIHRCLMQPQIMAEEALHGNFYSITVVLHINFI